MEVPMLGSTSAKRARAIVIALAITFATNYAITYAAKPTGSRTANDASGVMSQSSARSGPAGTARPAPPPPSGASN